MGKWKRLPGNLPNSSPSSETPLERAIAAEEALLAAEERALESLEALEALAALEASTSHPLVPFTPPHSPIPQPLPPEPESPICTHYTQTSLYVTTSDGLLYIYDPVTGVEQNHYRIIDEALTGGFTENFIAVDPLTGTLYLSNYLNYNYDEYGTTVQVANDEGILTTIDVGEAPAPATIDTQRGLLYQANLNTPPSSGPPPFPNPSISVINLHTNAVIGTIAFSALETPFFTLVDPITGKVYVVGDAYNADYTEYHVVIWQLHPDSLTVTPLRAISGISLGYITPDFEHDTLYFNGASDTSGASFIAIYNITQDTIMYYEFPYYYFTNLTYDPTTARVYATANYPSNNYIFIFDPAQPSTLTTAAITPTGNFYYGIDFSPEDHIVYVVGDAAVLAYDTNDWQLVYSHTFSNDHSIIPYDVKLGHICDQWA
jgi:DNA-binding beta-propeller fold protein YncE